MLPPLIQGSCFLLRPWRLEDRASLVRHANNRAIWRNLWDSFPHPYTETDADLWLEIALAHPSPEGVYAIDIDGSAVGTIALERRDDIERLSAEIGYWLGESFWGRGITTEAVSLVCDAAFADPELIRIFAPVFAWNRPSMRVLERNGFAREGVMQRAGIKDGVVVDRILYARTRPSDLPYFPAG